MTEETARDLRRRLTGVGLSPSAIRAAWPPWWTPEAAKSLSAQTDLRFALARYLGLDPHSLLDQQREPQFVWGSDARFKRLTAEDDVQRESIASFGHAITSLLIAASAPARGIEGESASDLRRIFLDDGIPYIRLVDLLSLSWAVGIPVIHLRVFPGKHKRMSAMTVRHENRYAILLAKDSLYPAPIAFYLAHELGHLALSHLGDHTVIVDLDAESGSSEGDDEEIAADGFGLELLTGDATPTVVSLLGRASGRSLADVALRSGGALHIEPGVLAMCFGYSSGSWRTANAALPYIYASEGPAWLEVNTLAAEQLNLARLPLDGRAYLERVMGLA